MNLYGHIMDLSNIYSNFGKSELLNDLCSSTCRSHLNALSCSNFEGIRIHCNNNITLLREEAGLNAKLSMRNMVTNLKYSIKFYFDTNSGEKLYVEVEHLKTHNKLAEQLGPGHHTIHFNVDVNGTLNAVDYELSFSVLSGDKFYIYDITTEPEISTIPMMMLADQPPLAQTALHPEQTALHPEHTALHVEH